MQGLEAAMLRVSWLTRAYIHIYIYICIICMYVYISIQIYAHV